MQLIDSLGNAITLNTANFTSTGGWQNWQTTNTSEVFWLNKGIHHIRVLITLQEYNLNWFQFDVVASNEKILIENDISVVPNPASDFINIILPDERVIGNLEILDLFGRVVFNSKSNTLNVSSLPNGIYILNIEAEGDTFQKKFIKK
jgi:hypothetical protein